MSLFDVITPRITELGKIKIGGKSSQVRTSKTGGQWRAPEKYDHFIITTLYRNAQGDLVRDDALMNRLIEEGHGDSDGKLRTIPISVLSNDIEDIVQSSYLAYAGRKLAARSDGETLIKYADKGKWLEVPVVEPWKPEMAQMRDGKGNLIFKQHTIFNCVILTKMARWGGVYKFRTTSSITASQIVGSLLEIRELMVGVLRGLPMRLALRPMQVSPDGRPTTIYVAHCELVGDDIISLQNTAKTLLQREVETSSQIVKARLEYKQLMKPPGVDESPLEQAEISEEFHPEEVEKAAPNAIDPLLSELGVTGKNDTEKPIVVDAEIVESAKEPDSDETEQVEQIDTLNDDKPKEESKLPPYGPNDPIQF